MYVYDSLNTEQYMIQNKIRIRILAYSKVLAQNG